MTRSPHTPDLFAGPPPEVLVEVDAAWERAQELFESGLELHFQRDSSTGRVRAELRLPGGAVIEHLSATKALLRGCGDAVAGALVPA